MMSFKIEGLEEVRKRLRELEQRAQQLHGEHAVPFSELFLASFMSRHTDFASIDEMVAESPWEVETEEDFRAIPDGPWDEFVAKRTRFSSWQEMLEAATADWARKELGL